MRLSWLSVVVGLALVGCNLSTTSSTAPASHGAVKSIDEIAADADAVQRYCRYGAVSEAQLKACLDHVSIREIQSLNTSAARFGLARRTTVVSTRGRTAA